MRAAFIQALRGPGFDVTGAGYAPHSPSTRLVEGTLVASSIRLLNIARQPLPPVPPDPTIDYEVVEDLRGAYPFMHGVLEVPGGTSTSTAISSLERESKAVGMAYHHSVLDASDCQHSHAFSVSLERACYDSLKGSAFFSREAAGPYLRNISFSTAPFTPSDEVAVQGEVTLEKLSPTPLPGNRQIFSFPLRDVAEVLRRACDAVQSEGFINYYPVSLSESHVVGSLLEAAKHTEAVSTYLAAASRRNPVLRNAIQYGPVAFTTPDAVHKGSDPTAAALVLALHSGLDAKRALKAVFPPELLAEFSRAAANASWNRSAAARARRGMVPLVGDLAVMPDGSVAEVTEETVSRVAITDVVLPCATTESHRHLVRQPLKVEASFVEGKEGLEVTLAMSLPVGSHPVAVAHAISSIRPISRKPVP